MSYQKNSIILIVTLGLLICGCAPSLTEQERREDIQFLADWAERYSPFVEANEKVKGCPSYRKLLPQYIEYAEQATTNQEFLYVVMGYYYLICDTGHAYIWKWGNITMNYWGRLYSRYCQTKVPFRIYSIGHEYFVSHDWQTQEGLIPKDSQILTINGLSCIEHLEFAKKNSWYRYLPVETWFTKHVLSVKESEEFQGWHVEFLKPDGKVQKAFVPCGKKPAFKNSFKDKSDNCICVELNDLVGYIRIKSFYGKHIEEDQQEIRRFLACAKRKYDKLIIDVRDNPGGDPLYYYLNLIAPLIKETATYSQVAGLKRKFISDNSGAYIDGLRGSVSKEGSCVTAIEEIEPPGGYDSKDWIFYEVTREIEAKDPYNFNGDIYVLVNDRSYSAAEGYAINVKKIGYAKLAGTNTPGGAAVYIAPHFITLPNSGMEFIVEADMAINPDGSIVEIVGTAPDIALNPSNIPDVSTGLTREVLLEDEWIKNLMAREREKETVF
jgi:hypothetical protein